MIRIDEREQAVDRMATFGVSKAEVDLALAYLPKAKMQIHFNPDKALAMGESQQNQGGRGDDEVVMYEARKDGRVERMTAPAPGRTLSASIEKWGLYRCESPVAIGSEAELAAHIGTFVVTGPTSCRRQ